MERFWLGLNARAGWFFWLGLLVLVLWNLRGWLHDRVFVRRWRQLWPLPSGLQSKPQVSVLVAAWNEAPVIQKHIASFLALRYPNKELVLCAGGEDGTFELAQRMAGARVTVLRQHPGEGKQGALKRALARATGEVVFLTDADCLLTDEVLERLLVPLVNEGEAVATGTLRPLPVQRRNLFVLHRWFNEVWSVARSIKSDYTRGVVGANTMLYRDVLREVEGFEGEVYTGIDYHLAKRLLQHGYRIRYVPRSAVSTAYAENFDTYRRRQTRWLRNVVIHGIRFKVYDEVLRGLLPSVIGAFMLVWPLLMWMLGPLAVVMWAWVWIYVLLRRVRYILFAEGVTGETFAWAGYLFLPIYVLEDFVVWAWTLVQYAFRGWRWQW